MSAKAQVEEIHYCYIEMLQQFVAIDPNACDIQVGEIIQVPDYEAKKLVIAKAAKYAQGEVTVDENGAKTFTRFEVATRNPNAENASFPHPVVVTNLDDQRKVESLTEEVNRLKAELAKAKAKPAPKSAAKPQPAKPAPKVDPAALHNVGGEALLSLPDSKLGL